jgi:hypothetical protein
MIIQLEGDSRVQHREFAHLPSFRVQRLVEPRFVAAIYLYKLKHIEGNLTLSMGKRGQATFSPKVSSPVTVTPENKNGVKSFVG